MPTSTTMGITYHTYPTPSPLQTTLYSSPLSLPNGGLTSLTTFCHPELVTFGNTMSYTSLRDLIPPSPDSQSFTEIPIKNRLVQQAAWAYLQPMSASPKPDNTWFLRRLCNGDCIMNQVDGCLGFVTEGLLPMFRRAFDGVFGRLRGKDVTV